MAQDVADMFKALFTREYHDRKGSFKIVLFSLIFSDRRSWVK